jgi:4-amino-4-deoxy-L-arabinose transferase-like glycosyltransferase
VSALGVAHLMALVAATAGCAWWASRRLAGSDPLERAVVASLVALAIPQAVGIVLGAAGLLRPVPTIVALVALSVAVVVDLRRRPAAPAAREGQGPGAVTLVALLLATTALALSLRVGFDAGRSLHFETQHYHVAAVEHFRDGGTIWTLPFQNPSVFTSANPSGNELTSAILSFATGSDRLIYGWIHPTSTILVMLGAGLLARELGGRPEAGAVAALAVALCPLAIISVHSLANDLVPVAGLVTALALVLRARSPGAHPALLACAGLALGLGMGSKYTAFVGAALVVLAAVIAGHARRTVWLAPGMVALAGPWLLRNALELGNPVYPQRLRVAGVELFEGGSGPYDELSGTVLAHLVHRRNEAIDLWLDLIRMFCWPLAITAVLGAGLVLLRRRGVDPRCRLAAGLVAVGLIVAYLVTPYTGGGIPPIIDVMGSNLRYALAALVVGSVVLAAVLPRPVDLGVALGLVAWSVWRSFERPMRPDLELTTPVVAVGLAAAMVAAVAVAETFALHPSARGRAAPRPSIRLALGAVAPVALVAGTVVIDGGQASEPRPLEVAVARAVALAGADPTDAKVGVIGVTDLLSVVGPELERRPEQVTDPRATAPLSARELDEAVMSSDAPVLVLGVDDPAIPDGYVPPPSAWCPTESIAGTTVFVRDDSCIDPAGVP